MSTGSEPGHGRPELELSAIMSERRRLINLAYRLLGSLAETEDAAVHYVRHHGILRQAGRPGRL